MPNTLKSDFARDLVNQNKTLDPKTIFKPKAIEYETKQLKALKYETPTKKNLNINENIVNGTKITSKKIFGKRKRKISEADVNKRPSKKERKETKNLFKSIKKSNLKKRKRITTKFDENMHPSKKLKKKSNYELWV